ncbi:putrescine hydroxycinnamoyltransferase 1-like isoform X2 [Dioscorea cayenensis subsp. rotundata]|uniref:Putrescine hydroxycinnamoyltransferase 1-like isoform X2 n=1 Tax=Dioscorea cayennensis subsp. rotundata TaxID=55577 RepID=A0AB40BR18_DIOCR|nr:putrescine hydroxycinnamoyltransferase 1-like isoform X2 [Dioscorea cayenensis subsp. rotundata]
MAPKVEIIESCMVAPCEETPKHRLQLSNLDAFAPRDHMPTFFLYKPNNGDPNFFSVQILKKALSKVLVTFYPLAGELVFDEDGRPVVDCNTKGVLFSAASTSCTLDGFGDFRPSSTLDRLFIPSVTNPKRSCILLLFQCGGVCLGCASHHSVIDGVTLFNFINTWSDIARGSNMIISAPPFLDCTVLRARSPPIVSFDHIEYTNCNFLEDKFGQECETTILTLSKAQLNTLKHGSHGERNLSTYKAVAVHLWSTACKARELADGQETRLYMWANARNRLKPPLSKGYLGNAVLKISTQLQVGDLVSKPFEFGIAKIDETINSVNDEYIRSLVDLWEKHKGEKEKIKGSRSYRTVDFLVVSWLSLPTYEADFGWGKPWFMGKASMKYAGQAYVMRGGPGNNGGVSIAIALESENMPRFKKMVHMPLEAKI